MRCRPKQEHMANELLCRDIYGFAPLKCRPGVQAHLCQLVVSLFQSPFESYLEFSPAINVPGLSFCPPPFPPSLRLLCFLSAPCQRIIGSALDVAARPSSLTPPIPASARISEDNKHVTRGAFSLFSLVL